MPCRGTVNEDNRNDEGRNPPLSPVPTSHRTGRPGSIESSTPEMEVRWDGLGRKGAARLQYGFRSPSQPVEGPVEEPSNTVEALASSSLARAFRSGGGI